MTRPAARPATGELPGVRIATSERPAFAHPEPVTRPPEPAPAVGGRADTEDEPGGWGPPPEPATDSGTTPPRVIPTPRRPASGPLVRVMPVLMVTVVCLSAVGLSAPSPVGWAMLGVGLLGLAASWVLFGQERRLKELEHRLAGTGAAPGLPDRDHS